jgi:hypothetical protein
MRKIPDQRREKILGLLPGHAHVEGIRAKIQPPRPFQCPLLRNCHLLEKTGLKPRGKHATARIGGKINNSGNPILKSQEEAKVIRWFYFKNLHHPQLLQKTDPV